MMRSGVRWTLLVAATAPAALAAQMAPSAILGDWSASIAGTQWDLHFNRAAQYAIFRVSTVGDTLVLSMGSWSIDDGALCLAPPGRDPICGPLRIQHPNERARAEWSFRERASGFGWLAYRRGYAPWDRWTPSRDSDVFDLTDVTTQPRFLGCTEPLLLPPGIVGPVKVFARLVVEIDSTVSEVEVLEAPSEEIEVRARAIANSCRLAPGKLDNGVAVRVRVEFPIEFPGGRR